jgi:Exo70 exocyst complex subunit
MRMLAQVLRWESELAGNIVPETHLAQALDAILSGAVGNAVDAGHALAGGRVSPEKLFPLLHMISCMHDPFVLPCMKAAFRQPALRKAKDKFHALLAALCSAAQAAVHSFTASLTGDVAPARKEPAAVTTVSQQTAFALRFLKARCSLPPFQLM